MTVGERTFIANCPHCGVAVVTKPRDLRLHLDVEGLLTVDAQLIGTHRCTPVPGEGAR